MFALLLERFAAVYRITPPHTFPPHPTLIPDSVIARMGSDPDVESVLEQLDGKEADFLFSELFHYGLIYRGLFPQFSNSNARFSKSLDSIDFEV